MLTVLTRTAEATIPFFCLVNKMWLAGCCAPQAIYLYHDDFSQSWTLILWDEWRRHNDWGENRFTSVCLAVWSGSHTTLLALATWPSRSGKAWSIVGKVYWGGHFHSHASDHKQLVRKSQPITTSHNLDFDCHSTNTPSMHILKEMSLVDPYIKKNKQKKITRYSQNKKSWCDINSSND